MAALTAEQMRILFFDQGSGSLIDEKIHFGTATQVEVRYQQIVRQAFLLESAFIVLSHNHPSGDPNPSRQDIDYTRRIVSVCKALDIRVHDHIIVSPNGSFSFRERGYM
ncbi:JAB domain-containing protein [Sphingobium sp. Cam5-1]|uniref:JAB domain-containing protein n=1 Tax=Sphingobium sp. Cam5-1 TaxID=2789327 RepID=UPI0018AD18B3|nr:JAB domain-containing protein [Sphingobium sp. Cam5-1]QPI72488.1 JAB domain-containing protein [Sphingobium sp. Cam5-1]